MLILPQDVWEIQTTEHKGRGIFAKKEIPAGTIIGDFIGKLMPDSYNDEYEKEFGYYSMEWSDTISIYPDPSQPGIHLINHSCMPNCENYTYKAHVLYFTLRKIFPGEELTTYYTIDPPSKENPYTEACRCGTKLCRGVYHVEFNSHSAPPEPYLPEPPVPMGEILPLLNDYPDSIEDDGEYDLFGSDSQSPEIYDEASIPAIDELRKRIRATGKYLQFSQQKMLIIGIMNGLIVGDVMSK